MNALPLQQFEELVADALDQVPAELMALLTMMPGMRRSGSSR